MRFLCLHGAIGNTDVGDGGHYHEHQMLTSLTQNINIQFGNYHLNLRIEIEESLIILQIP